MNGLHSVNFDFGKCHGLCYTNFGKRDGRKPRSETIKNGIEIEPNNLLNEIQFKNQSKVKYFELMHY